MSTRPKRTHRSNKLLRQIHALKAQFDKAHADGMKALHAGKLDAVTDAIARERVVIDKQRRLFSGSTKRH